MRRFNLEVILGRIDRPYDIDRLVINRVGGLPEEHALWASDLIS